MVKQTRDENLNPIQAPAFRPKSVVDVTAGSTSDAFTSNVLIRVVLATTGYIEIAPTPNDSIKVYMAAGIPEYFTANKGDKVKATTGNANITIFE
jgi:hypothetical protein